MELNKGTEAGGDIDREQAGEEQDEPGHPSHADQLDSRGGSPRSVVAEVKAEDKDPSERYARQGEEAPRQMALQSWYRPSAPKDIDLQDGKENSEDGSKHTAS
jgi:hypothetical protein